MGKTSTPDHPIQRVSRDVTARGVRMRVIEAGMDNEQAVILVHGYLVSHLEFDDIIDPLARRFHVIAPDLPGFGESEKPNPARYSYGVDTFAEAIADLVAAYGLGHTSVLGHSMGGAVAITLAAHYGELVTRMTLVDPLCYQPPRDVRRRMILVPVLGGFFFRQLLGRALFRAFFRDTMLLPEATLPNERIDHYYDELNTPAARGSAGPRPSAAVAGRELRDSALPGGHLSLAAGRAAHAAPDGAPTGRAAGGLSARARAATG